MSFVLRSYFLALVVVSTSWGAINPLDIPLFGVGNREVPRVQADHYLNQVQPILSARCVACHGCYEAPCSLNMESYEGVRRGFHATPLFAPKRFGIAKPTRPIDGKSLAQWREQGFFPVLPSLGDVPEGEKENPKDSIFYRLVDQSARNNAPGFDIKALKPLQEKADSATPQCLATQDQFNGFFSRKENNLFGVKTIDDVLTAHPLSGMPFALPKLDEAKEKVILGWAEAGAKGPATAAMAELETPRNPSAIAAWEAFLNGNSAKEQQTGRYLYEHTFTAHAHFDESPGEFYELVRAKNLSGRIEQIVTELPYDAPGVDRVYYRFKKITRAIPQKNHLVWKLNDQRLAHLKNQFLNAPEWKDAKVPFPSYGSPNPFRNFAAIPARVRSRFMMENAKIIVAGMTQGAVCVGSTATYAIADHFWSWFLLPENDPSVQFPSLGFDDIDMLATAPLGWSPSNALERAAVARIDRLVGPDIEVAKKIVKEANKLFKWKDAQYTSATLEDIALRLKESKLKGIDIVGALHHYMRTSKANYAYQEAFEKNLRKLLKKQGGDHLSLHHLWKGDGDSSYPDGNPNAWLNITRHGRSATVQFGEAGGVPQSIWVMSYSNFERLYYNLVVSYKEWGSALHKMATWRHMSYVRLEGEDLAISLLPLEHREAVRARFTKGLAMLKQVAHFPHWSTVGMNESWHLNPLAGWDLPPRTSPYRAGKTADDAIQYVVAAAKEMIRPLSANELQRDRTVGAERAPFETKLVRLANRSEANRGELFARNLPHTSYLSVQTEDGGTWLYSMNVDRGYKAHNIMLAENMNREPEQDELTFYRGIVGNYPNTFFHIRLADADQFLTELEAVKSDKDAEKLKLKWAISRNSDKFWPYYDWLHQFKATSSPGIDPLEQGITDLSQYELF